MEDAEIIRLILAGHHEQYAGLVQRYQEPLIHFLRRILNSDEDSFDCAQEAFLAAYRNINRYSKEYPFQAWLYAIARNKALDLMRKRIHRGKEKLRQNLERGEIRGGGKLPKRKNLKIIVTLIISM